MSIEASELEKELLSMVENREKVIKERKEEKEKMEETARQEEGRQKQKNLLPLLRNKRATFEEDQRSHKAKQFPGAVVETANACGGSSKVTHSDYLNTKIQIRMLNGDKVEESFGVQEKLEAVKRFVKQLNREDCQFDFTFKMSFPDQKIFNDEDMMTPIHQLGLVPSAVIMVEKLQP